MSDSQDEYIKKFEHLSKIARFHLAPKLFGEDAKVAETTYQDPKVREWFKDFQKESSKSKSENMRTISGDHFLEVIKKINEIKLNQKGQMSAADQQKLINCRIKIKEYFQVTLTSVREYVSSIIALDEARLKDNPDEKQRTDQARKLKHNKLMDEIAITNRALLWWFGKFDPETIENETVQSMYDRQKGTYISENIERMEIGKNGICPDKFNLNDRHQVTAWAEQIYADLSNLGIS